MNEEKSGRVEAAGVKAEGALHEEGSVNSIWDGEATVSWRKETMECCTAHSSSIQVLGAALCLSLLS